VRSSEDEMKEELVKCGSGALLYSFWWGWCSLARVVGASVWLGAQNVAGRGEWLAGGV